MDADSEVTSELEIVSGELELWYPAWSGTLDDALEEPHLLGLVTALLTFTTDGLRRSWVKILP